MILLDGKKVKEEVLNGKIEIPLPVATVGGTISVHPIAKWSHNLMKNPKKEISGKVAFRLYDTFGFPLELTEELGAENGFTVDKEGFKEAERKHQEASKSADAGAAKGGECVPIGGIACHHWHFLCHTDGLERGVGVCG